MWMISEPTELRGSARRGLFVFISAGESAVAIPACQKKLPFRERFKMSDRQCPPPSIIE